MYEHIFFDLDSTLWDLDKNSHETITDLASVHKLSERGVDSINDFIAVYKVINEELWDKYRKGMVDRETLRYERFRRALSNYGIHDPALTISFGNDFSANAPLKTHLFENTIEVLEYLSGKYQLHIITNGFEETQHIKMKSCGITKYFSEIITSEKAGCLKPDPRMFEYSLNLTKANSGNSIMIGDSLEVDIVGAREMGMRQIYFNPEAKAHSELVTHEIRELKELMSLL